MEKMISTEMDNELENIQSMSTEKDIIIRPLFDEVGEVRCIEILRPMAIRLREEDTQWLPDDAVCGVGDIGWAVEQNIIHVPWGRDIHRFGLKWCKNHKANREHIIPELIWEWCCYEDMIEYIKYL